SLKTSIKTITYLSDTGCLEIQGASLGTRVKSQEVRYLYSEYFADDTSLCQMKLTSFSITTFFQKQEIGYQEAGCYDKASCFLSEERF
ncbi:hypothetical protein, partial [Escherichia coli]|uniref:hypothetical protein n=7 Tax=Enterobacterales TaxID=91347 RepID=UPI001BC887C5